MTRNASTTLEQEPAAAPRKSSAVNSVASASGLQDFQREAGNRTVSEWLQSRLSEEQHENGAGLLQTKSKDAGAEGIAERQADQAAEKATQITPAKSLLADDDAKELQAGQMKKGEFLGQLRSSVSTAAEQSLSRTIWSAMGCPYLDRWFNHFEQQPAARVERALLKYAPEAAAAKNAREYIPIVTQRVRQGIGEWSETGEVSGLPEEFAGGEMPGATVSGLLSGALSGIGNAVSEGLSSVGSMLFKRRAGEEREAGDPQVIRDQLGGGQPLDSRAKTRLQSAFGTDFSDVRVHTDATAQDLSGGLNARAFTIGTDIAFGPGEYQPGTVVGDSLIAHELAHVVQQSGSGTASDPQRKASDLDNDADRSAIAAMVSLAGGAFLPQAKPRLRSGLSLQRCGHGKQETKTATTPTTKKTEDWEFTPADYEALAASGQKLRFSSDSDWFPAPLKENLLSTLDYLLGSKEKKKGTEAVNVKDFYHGHVVLKQRDEDPLPKDIQNKINAYYAKERELKTKVFGEEYVDVNEENVGKYAEVVQGTIPAAKDLLTDTVKQKNVAVIYHTFEYVAPSDVTASGGSLRPGDPRRNYLTPLDTNKPGPYSPPDPDNASSYTKDYSHIFQFAFLIDNTGEIHVLPGSTRELGTLTGKP